MYSKISRTFGRLFASVLITVNYSNTYGMCVRLNMGGRVFACCLCVGYNIFKTLENSPKKLDLI